MTRVKVCGLTRVVDVQDAAKLGAWALGAVFSESPRRVTPQEATRLFALAPPDVLTVAVFTTESAAEVAAAAAIAGAGAVQLSAGADGPSVAAVRQALHAVGVSVPVIIAAADTIDFEQADYVLLDSRLEAAVSAGAAAGTAAADGTAAAAGTAAADEGTTAGVAGEIAATVTPVYGGTGQTLDWRSIETPAERALVLAGGITATNVGAAIAAVRPFAVDVSSGVEQAPGVKDARLLRRFFAAVRAADDQADRGGKDQSVAKSDRLDDRQS